MSAQFGPAPIHPNYETERHKKKTWRCGTMLCYPIWTECCKYMSEDLSEGVREDVGCGGEKSRLV